MCKIFNVLIKYESWVIKKLCKFVNVYIILDEILCIVVYVYLIIDKNWNRKEMIVIWLWFNEFLKGRNIDNYLKKFVYI